MQSVTCSEADAPPMAAAEAGSSSGMAGKTGTRRHTPPLSRSVAFAGRAGNLLALLAEVVQVKCARAIIRDALDVIMLFAGQRKASSGPQGPNACSVFHFALVPALRVPMCTTDRGGPALQRALILSHIKPPAAPLKF
jgi:hypothetical protein